MRRSRRPSSPLENPAFRRWFGDSVVVDEDGEPLVVYHGAKSSFDMFDFDRAVDLGMHFGTREQAEEAVEAVRERGIVRPFYLRLERPLKLRDPGDWIAPEGATMAPPVPTQLAELGLIDSETEDALLEPLYDAPRTWDYGSSKKRAALSRMLRDAIIELGFDGVVYENTFEEHATGEDSLIAFFPEQIKLADGTNTTFDPGSADVRKNPAKTLSSDETANEYDRGRSNDFLTGGCLDWAQAYIDHVGGTLIGVFVNGSMEHVMAKDGKFVVDAVGVHRPSAVVSWFKKSWKTKDVKLSEPRSKDLRLLDTDDDRYADAFADVYNEYNQDPRFRG